MVDVPVGDGRSEELPFCGVFSGEDGDFCDETFVGEVLEDFANDMKNEGPEDEG